MLGKGRYKYEIRERMNLCCSTGIRGISIKLRQIYVSNGNTEVLKNGWGNSKWTKEQLERAPAGQIQDDSMLK